MLLDIVKKGVTDRSVILRIIDSADGTPETGVVFNTAGIDLWYRREGAAKTSITEATLSALTDAHSDGGFLAVGDGYYRLDLPDAAFATGANYVDVGGTVTGMVVIGGRVRLVSVDLEDTVRAGLTALPNAAADAAGGLPISDAGGLDLDAQVGTKINDILTDTGTTLQGELDGIQADTEDIQTRLPAALVSGRIDASVGAMAANVMTAAAAAADLTAELQSGLATAAALATVDGIVDDILVDTAEIGAAGAGLTNINLPNQTMDIVGNITGNLSGSVGSVTAGVTLAASAVQAIWDALTSALTTVGSIGKLLVDNINATISSRLASASYTAPPTVGQIADQVWDETLADHLGAGSTGAGLNAAGSAGDPWSTALPGAYGAGSAGKIVGDNLNATVGSRASQTSVDDLPTNAELATALGTADDAVLAQVALVKAKTDLIPASPAAVGSAMTLADDAITASKFDESTAFPVKSDDAGATQIARVGADGDTLETLSDQIDAKASQSSVDDLPTNAELATALGTADDAVLTQVALVKAKTDLLPSDPADQSAVEAAITAATSPLATAANLATVDTVVDAIKVIADALTAAAAAKLAASALGIITGTVDTAGFSPTTTEFEADDITEATADHYIGRIVTFTSGVLLGQSTDITDYALATGRGHFTVTALTEAAGNNDTFVIS